MPPTTSPKNRPVAANRIGNDLWLVGDDIAKYIPTAGTKKNAMPQAIIIAVMRRQRATWWMKAADIAGVTGNLTVGDCGGDASGLTSLVAEVGPGCLMPLP